MKKYLPIIILVVLLGAFFLANSSNHFDLPER